MQYDVVIVGAGPAGICCAMELQRRGSSVLLIEKGCLANSLNNFPSYMRFFTSSGELEIGGMPMASRDERPSRTEALNYYQQVAKRFDLRIRQYERVLTVDGEDGRFQVRTSKSLYLARKIVIASGYSSGQDSEAFPKDVVQLTKPFDIEQLRRALES